MPNQDRESFVTLQERDWQRQLERERYSMLAMSPGADFPGPGAAAKKADDDAQASAKEVVAEAERALTPIAGIMRTRMMLWGAILDPTLVFGSFSLAGLHVHKFVRDGKIKDTAKKVGAALKRLPPGAMPHARLARLIVGFAGGLLLAEWIVVAVLDLLLAIIIGGAIAILSIAIYCTTNASECGWSALVGT